MLFSSIESPSWGSGYTEEMEGFVYHGSRYGSWGYNEIKDVEAARSCFGFATRLSDVLRWDFHDGYRNAATT